MIYRITVQGNLDPGWSDWFNGMEILAEPGQGQAGITILRGNIPDQAGLRGILNHLWDLNVSILALACLEAADPAAADPATEIPPLSGEKPGGHCPPPNTAQNPSVS